MRRQNVTAEMNCLPNTMPSMGSASVPMLSTQLTPCQGAIASNSEEMIMSEQPTLEIVVTQQAGFAGAADTVGESGKEAINTLGSLLSDALDRSDRS